MKKYVTNVLDNYSHNDDNIVSFSFDMLTFPMHGQHEGAVIWVDAGQQGRANQILRKVSQQWHGPGDGDQYMKSQSHWK